MTDFLFSKSARLLVAVGAIATLAGCASRSDILSRDAARVYTSDRGREVITDCLQNRLTSEVITSRVERRADENIVSFGSTMGGAILVFIVRDQGAGSVIEMRRRFSITPGRLNAETCF
ncbi:hypothetical protein GG804_23920 [Sphingomonas histidinilytica]|uniref:hypothetical protein n=1 Tax=Rhizorhabdus histidinilytica TaxID=439228 RepID=UPI000F771B87|nr:hypothetical protein [Rhizorhabdus histidinilytica]MBO9379822.1 hypothetical protein [Rhizorhabdus histidinilytica]QEH81147.1 hypothetical protein EIK56_24910 [Sphingomonas sp. C8-2]